MSLGTIGARIRFLREQKGWSQMELAQQLGIRAPSVSQLETGVSRRPSSTTLLRLAAVLDANPEWIIHGRGDPHADADNAGNMAELIDTCKQLSPGQRAALIAAAKALLLSQ